MSFTADEQIIAQRIRNGNLEILTPGSLVHRIPVASVTKEVWEPVDASGIKPDASAGDQSAASPVQGGNVTPQKGEAPANPHHKQKGGN